ncbi:hypothetical protein GCM10011519_05740 [Marmoricola endophyticus]|uniref:PDZ domain-containing protein n=1 Tax=Marmoricola endophyticus TaxID=2040280 RepID=A0A917BBK4_9ACTN|nr:trypsin-like peptidase domain-containing protein [Marmoricola endophyticus]GGF35154.1 hypothetical protein GCM10011519_05740 [Marmoricola endophyticus]
MTHSRTSRRLLRSAVGASAAVLLAGGTTLAVGSAVADGVDGTHSERTTAIARPDNRAFPGSGAVVRRGTQSASQEADDTQVAGLVRIQTEVDFGEGEAAGTGMVLTSDGEVVTNHHVVAGATAIEATDMATGRTYTARVVGTDASDDVAVLRLEDASGLTTVRTDTDGLSVGDAVTAVGDANGTADLSSAAGTVTALDRSITTQSEQTVQGERLTGLIELDADVISGDSGGATYDAEGEVVGMTTAASSGSAEVTGYAIPIDRVLAVADDLSDGVSGADYTYGLPAFLGVALGQGGTLAGVYDDSAAASAGLAAGDTITAIDGTSVSGTSGLSRAIAAHSPGDEVSLTWTDQAGASHDATVTLGDGPVA